MIEMLNEALEIVSTTLLGFVILIAIMAAIYTAGELFRRGVEMLPSDNDPLPYIIITLLTIVSSYELGTDVLDWMSRTL